MPDIDPTKSSSGSRRPGTDPAPQKPGDADPARSSAETRDTDPGAPGRSAADAHDAEAAPASQESQPSESDALRSPQGGEEALQSSLTELNKRLHELKEDLTAGALGAPRPAGAEAPPAAPEPMPVAPPSPAPPQAHFEAPAPADPQQRVQNILGGAQQMADEIMRNARRQVAATQPEQAGLPPSGLPNEIADAARQTAQALRYTQDLLNLGQELLSSSHSVLEALEQGTQEAQAAAAAQQGQAAWLAQPAAPMQPYPAAPPQYPPPVAPPGQPLPPQYPNLPAPQYPGQLAPGQLAPPPYAPPQYPLPAAPPQYPPPAAAAYQGVYPPQPVPAPTPRQGPPQPGSPEPATPTPTSEPPAAAAPAEPIVSSLSHQGQVTLTAGPLTDVAAAAVLERALEHIPAVSRARVKRFVDDRAVIELTVSEPVTLADELRRVLPYPFEIQALTRSQLDIVIPAKPESNGNGNQRQADDGTEG